MRRRRVRNSLSLLQVPNEALLHCVLCRNILLSLVNQKFLAKLWLIQLTRPPLPRLLLQYQPLKSQRLLLSLPLWNRLHRTMLRLQLQQVRFLCFQFYRGTPQRILYG